MVIQQEHKVILKITTFDRPLTIILPKANNEEVLFTMSEADALEVNVRSTKYYVDIDHFSTNQKIRISSNERKTIVRGKDHWNQAYIPGTYTITLRNIFNEEVVHYNFIVRPVGVNIDYRNHLIHAINEYLQDVHQHQSYKRKQEIEEVKQETNPSIVHILHLLSNHLRTMIEPSYVYESTMKKTNGKAIRKQIKNPSKNEAKSYLNRTFIISYNTKENQALKFILFELLKQNLPIHYDLQMLYFKLKEIEMNPYAISSLAAYPYYRELYHYYRNNKDQHTQQKQKKIINISRKTPDLFELYALILILKSYIKQGFRYASSKEEIIEQLSNRQYGKITLMKENEVIKIDYDVELKNNVKGIISVNSHSQRPDFIIKKFINNELLHVDIVEVKCRAHKSIFTSYQQLERDIENQCRDYLNLGYVDEHNNLQLGIINNVYLIYPAEQKATHHYFYHRISSIGISPTSTLQL